MFKLDLFKASLKEVVEGLEKGQFTSVQLLKAYFERIHKDDVNGLGLRSIMEEAPKDLVFGAAERLDSERADGKLRSRLHGVPIVIKEGISTHPSMGMKTTGGLIALEDSEVEGNAPVVDALLAAGVIILGKANMSVLNNFYGGISSGWSPRGGQVRSAYVGADFQPSGSSSGSAVALSAGFCAGAIGCETQGSIVGVHSKGRAVRESTVDQQICPALRAGLYAIKPTAQLVPNEGIIPISKRIDTAGPMGKSAWDVAAMLDVMVDAHRDTYLKAVTDQSMHDSGLQKMGIARRGASPSIIEGPEDNVYPVDLQRQAETVFALAVQKLSPLIVKDPADIPRIEDIWQSLEEGQELSEGKWVSQPVLRLFFNDFYHGLNAHLASRQGGSIRSLSDLLRWSDNNPSLAYPPGSASPKCERLRESVRLAGKDPKYAQALQQVKEHAEAIDRFFETSDLDVILFSSGLGTSGCRGIDVAAIRGYPLACIPISILENGQPYSVPLLGRHGQDATVLRYMARVEQLVGIHPTPDRLNMVECEW